MYDEGSYFCSCHVHLKPSHPWKDKNSSLASEDCKRKDNYEGDKFTPSFFVGDHTIDAKKGEGVNGDKMVKEYFGSDPKEQEISYLNSSFEFPNEVEGKTPSAGCELRNLKEKNLMQREGHSLECWTLFQNYEA